MEYAWYEIFNLYEFLDTYLVSREFDVVLLGQGSKIVMVVRGNEVGIVYEETYLKINQDGNLIYEFNDHASFLDVDGNVWLGIPL